MDETTSPPSSPVSSSTLTSPEQNHQPGVPFYEELFCTPSTQVPLAGALIPSSPGLQSDVVKQGYLGKLERSHRRYFVLRGGSHTGPSRLEWYKSQEKFTAAEKTTGKAALFNSAKQGLVYLRCCLGVSRMSSSRKGHTVTLYAKDQTVVLVVEEEREQEEWYLAVKKLMEEERTDEGHDEEDDGVCEILFELIPLVFGEPLALLPLPHCKVWPVTVKPRGLGGSKSLTGESRLCLTATALILIRVGAGSNLRSVTIPLLSVRRFGHLDGSFFLELGRSAPNGPGEIWMEAKDQGNPAVAQHIHEVIREAVKDLRLLPDFSRTSPTSSSQLQSLLVSKRCRPKYRDKPAHVRPRGPRLLPGTPEVETPSYLELNESSTSPLRPHHSVPVPCSYVEMKSEDSPYRRALMMREEQSGVTASGEEEEEEEREERLGYMRMSPQTSSSELQQDDYMTMASPQKQPAFTSLQRSFNSSISDSDSPVPLNWPLIESESDQSESSISRPHDRGRARRPAPPRITSTPVKNENRTCRVNLFPESSTSPDSGARTCGRLQALHQSIRRSRLSLCFPSCFKSEDGS